jgi:hypothetical protein
LKKKNEPEAEIVWSAVEETLMSMNRSHWDMFGDWASKSSLKFREDVRDERFQIFARFLPTLTYGTAQILYFMLLMDELMTPHVKKELQLRCMLGGRKTMVECLNHVCDHYKEYRTHPAYTGLNTFVLLCHKGAMEHAPISLNKENAQRTGRLVPTCLRALEHLDHFNDIVDNLQGAWKVQDDYSESLTEYRRLKLETLRRTGRRPDSRPDCRPDSRPGCRQRSRSALPRKDHALEDARAKIRDVYQLAKEGMQHGEAFFHEKRELAQMRKDVEDLKKLLEEQTNANAFLHASFNSAIRAFPDEAEMKKYLKGVSEKLVEFTCRLSNLDGIADYNTKCKELKYDDCCVANDMSNNDVVLCIKACLAKIHQYQATETDYSRSSSSEEEEVRAQGPVEGPVTPAVAPVKESDI